MKKDNQPAPEYPEVLPCSVFLEPGLRFGKGVKTRLVLEAIQRRAEHYAELEAMTPEERAEYDAGIEAFKAMLPQPVPDNSAITQHFDTIALETAREIMCDVNRRHEFLGGEIQLLSRIQCRIDDACRAAMLQAEPVCTCPSGNGSLRWPCPVHPGSSPVIPDTWIPVSERMPEAEGHYLVWANASRIDGYCDHLAIATYQGGEWSNEFNWLVSHWMPLPAAPQEVKGE